MGRRLTPYERLLRSIRERSLQEQCREVAELLHAPYFHDADSRRNYAGLPDTVLVVPPVLCLWELKKETEQLRAEQETWASELQRCTMLDYRIVRPSTIGDDLSWLLRTTGRGE